MSVLDCKNSIVENTYFYFSSEKEWKQEKSFHFHWILCFLFKYFKELLLSKTKGMDIRSSETRIRKQYMFSFSSKNELLILMHFLNKLISFVCKKQMNNFMNKGNKYWSFQIQQLVISLLADG